MSQNPQIAAPQGIGPSSMLAALALVEARAAKRQNDVDAILAAFDGTELVSGLESVAALLLDVVVTRTGVPAEAVIAEARAGIAGLDV